MAQQSDVVPGELPIVTAAQTDCSQRSFGRNQGHAAYRLDTVIQKTFRARERQSFEFSETEGSEFPRQHRLAEHTFVNGRGFAFPEHFSNSRIDGSCSHGLVLLPIEPNSGDIKANCLSQASGGCRKQV